VQQNTTITDHIPSRKVVSCINNYIISEVVLVNAENKSVAFEKKNTVSVTAYIVRILPHNLQSIAWLQSMMMLYYLDRGINPDLRQHM